MRKIFIGLVMSYIYIKLIFGNKEGTPVNILDITYDFNFIKIKGGSLYVFGYHIHHWIIFLILYQSFPNANKIIKTFFVVMILHGLSYDDRFDI